MTHLIKIYLVPALLMTILSLLFWDKVKDAQFQSGVMHQHQEHNDYHADLVEVEKRAKEFAAKKSADRFTGKDGRELRAELKSEINHLKSRVLTLESQR